MYLLFDVLNDMHQCYIEKKPSPMISINVKYNKTGCGFDFYLINLDGVDGCSAVGIVHV